jgi:hypothetical protein
MSFFVIDSKFFPLKKSFFSWEEKTKQIKRFPFFYEFSLSFFLTKGITKKKNFRLTDLSIAGQPAEHKPIIQRRKIKQP